MSCPYFGSSLVINDCVDQLVIGTDHGWTMDDLPTLATQQVYKRSSLPKVYRWLYDTHQPSCFVTYIKINIGLIKESFVLYPIDEAGSTSTHNK